MDFFVNDVSNWYVRQNRHRFYDVDSADNRAAFATLHEILTVTCRLLAPIAPFVTDWMHRELNGESVHVAPYVRPEQSRVDPALERAMGDVRALANLGRAAREEAGIKVQTAAVASSLRRASRRRRRARCRARSAARVGAQRQAGRLRVVGGRLRHARGKAQFPNSGQEVRQGYSSRRSARCEHSAPTISSPSSAAAKLWSASVRSRTQCHSKT